jgi:hypothetical protein
MGCSPGGKEMQRPKTKGRFAARRNRKGRFAAAFDE